MANPRQKNIGTATILGIVALGIGAWLLTRGSDSAAPPDGSIPNRAGLNAGTEPDSGKTASREIALPGAQGERDGPAEYTSDTSSDPFRTATIEIHVHFAASSNPNEERTLRFRAVGEKSRRVVGESGCRARGREAIGYLEVPPNQWNHIEALVAGVHVPGRRLHVGPGDHYRIDLECGAFMTQLRVVGPSKELAPFLRIEVTDRGAKPAVPFELPLDADGVAACHFQGLASARLQTSHMRRRERGGELRTRAGGLEIDTSQRVVDLIPETPVLGIVVEHRRNRVAAAVGLDVPRPNPPPTECTVFAQHVAHRAGSIAIDVPGVGQMRGSIENVRRDGDLWRADTGNMQALGELLVTLDGEPTEATTAQLMAIPLAGGEPHPLNVDAKNERHALLPTGSYRLVWAPPGTARENAVDHVRVPPNEVTELTIAPRTLVRWTMQLRDLENETFMMLKFANVFSNGASSDGSFEVDLGRAPQIGETAQLLLHREKAGFVATIASIDHANRRAELTSPLAGAVSTRLVPVQLKNGLPRIFLLGTGEHPDAFGMHTAATLPMLPGTERHGYVTEHTRDTHLLTHWFTATAGTTELVLAPAGHWATMTFERPLPHAAIFCEGPSGHRARLRGMPRAGSQPFYVAAGTVAIHVEVAGVLQTFNPNLSEFVVR